MELVETGDWCVLYHADSTEIVDVLRGHSPDAVIMDPPYGIGFQRGYGGKTTTVVVGKSKELPGGIKAGTPKIIGDDEGIDPLQWLWAPQVLLWGADHLRTRIPAGGRMLAWDKTGGHDFHDDFADVEYAWHSERRAARLVSCLWKGAMTDNRGEGNGYRHHPMQKPIRVMEWCIEQCRLEAGATILDPYMGSGTTAIAAFKRRMNFVGVEIDRRWFDVAVERINRQTGDGPLFDAASPAEPELALA